MAAVGSVVSFDLGTEARAEAFLAALEEGLPDCCGVALGLDRVLMASAGLARIEEVVSFATASDS